MAGESTVARVLDILARIAGPERVPGNPGPATPLAKGGFWLDSLGLLETVLACEEAFGVALDYETDLRPGGLATVGGLVTAIERQARIGG
jgi:acyl carrier protein